MKRLATLVLCLAASAGAKRFYPDDPIWREPPPVDAGDVDPRQNYELVDFYKNSFHKKGQRHSRDKIYPSQGVNTLGEVPDSAWYTNRHALRRMTVDQLVQGPNVIGPPSPDGKWKVTGAKAEGVTPGLHIEDSRGNKYLLKFDPLSNPEMATASDVIGATFFHALGYNVPENYIVRFEEDQLTVPEGVKFTDKFGTERDLGEPDVEEMLYSVPREKDGRVRALASYFIEGKPLGGFRYYKRRADDPNELAPHEHLRVLRGLKVFAAWLNHTDAKALNSLDILLNDNGRKYVKHYLIDFGSAFGSDSLRAKDPRLGHEYMLDLRPARRQLLTLGLAVPKYARVDYPDDPAIGNFSAEAFDPRRWKPNYPNAAFANCLPGDAYWGAKKVMAFTDEEIRAIVATGEFSKPESARLLADILIKRRDIVGRVFFQAVAPLENFRVEDGRLKFDDLAVRYRFSAPVSYAVQWARFDNNASRSTPLPNATGEQLPQPMAAAAPGTYWSATLGGPEKQKSVTVFLRRDESAWTIVGIDRAGSDRWEPR